MNIGHAIKSLRNKQNISQRDLAPLCGITQPFLSQIENGDKNASTLVLKRICRVFKIAPVVLYIMAVDEKDVSRSKQEEYRRIWPALREIILVVFLK